METVLNNIAYWFMNSGWSLLFVVILFIVSYIVIKFLSWLFRKLLYKTKLDDAVVVFYSSLFKVILWIIIIFICAGILGFNTQYFILALGAGVVAIGLALKDSLGNVANGLLLIYNKPFRRGDWVLIDGIEGRVQNIKLLTTEIITFDNRKVVYPNNIVATQTVINFTAMASRRIDLVFSVAYGSDLNLVEKILKEIASGETRIHKNPAPVIAASNLNSSSIDFDFKVWVNTEDYYNTKVSLPKKVYEAFTLNKIKIPYQQIDIHMGSNKDE